MKDKGLKEGIVVFIECVSWAGLFRLEADDPGLRSSLQEPTGFPRLVTQRLTIHIPGVA